MRTIIEMVNHTRLDCAIGSAARDARGHRDGDPPRRPPLRLRQAARRPAADAERARRPRVESEAATISSLRLARAYDESIAGDERRDRVQAPRQRGAQVLDLQARPGARGRGARVPRRQRLRRGVGDAAALPRDAAGLDLGGLGQRPVPRRAARRWPAARPRSRRSSPRSARPRAPTRASTPTSPRLRDELDRPRGDRGPRAARRRADGARAPGLAAGPLRRRGRRRRLLRLAPRRRLGPARSGRCRPARDFKRIIERHTPQSSPTRLASRAPSLAAQLRRLQLLDPLDREQDREAEVDDRAGGAAVAERARR